jgi:hypothetical protein
MTVTTIGHAGPRMDSRGDGVAGSGLRAVLRSNDWNYVLAVRWGQWVRQPGVGVHSSHRGRSWPAMREWMSPRSPYLIRVTP